MTNSKRKRHYRECDGINREEKEGPPTADDDDQTLIRKMNDEPAYKALRKKGNDEGVQDALREMRTAWTAGKGVQLFGPEPDKKFDPAGEVGNSRTTASQRNSVRSRTKPSRS